MLMRNYLLLDISIVYCTQHFFQHTQQIYSWTQYLNSEVRIYLLGHGYAHNIFTVWYFPLNSYLNNVLIMNYDRKYILSPIFRFSSNLGILLHLTKTKIKNLLFSIIHWRINLLFYQFYKSQTVFALPKHSSWIIRLV